MEEYLFSNATYLPLFVEGSIPFRGRVFRGLPWNDEIPLYTIGYYGVVESLNLFVGGANLSCSLSFPLFCLNDNPTASLNLYTSGEGVNDGYLPINNSLLLFIKCKYGEQLPLYTHGGPQPSSNGTLNLYTIGAAPISADFPLSIPNVYGELNQSLKLYTHGF